MIDIKIIKGKAIIPEGTEIIPAFDSFEGRTELTSVEIPLSVKEIESYAFYGCTGLKSIVIPSSVTKIGWAPFLSCTGLEKIEVSAENKVYDSRENCNAIIETESNMLVCGCKNTIIPSSVKEIDEEAFHNCHCLTSIEIPSSVTEIGQYAFSCTGLTSIEIPSSVKEIAPRAFRGCSDLTYIGIPSSVKKIAFRAFAHCTGLTNIEIPSSVTKIGDDAFACCTGLTNIKIPSSVKEIGFVTFDHCKQLQEIHFERKGLKSVKWHETMLDGVDKEKCTIFVPKGMEEQYREHPAFEGFKIVEEGQVR